MIYQARQAYAMGQRLRYKPFEPILLACNEAIQACQIGDESSAHHAISYLHSMLDFRHASQQSAELARLYNHCEDLINRKEFDKALKILGSLRNTWVSIVRLTAGSGSEWNS